MAAIVLHPAVKPCPTCPYRRDVPSGIWDVSEYDKLPAYDGSIIEQAETESGPRLFGCHQSDGSLCAGWFAHRDPWDLLAIRLASFSGRVDPADIAGYTTDVPLFATGALALAHGMREYDEPQAQAVRAQQLIKRKKGVVTESSHKIMQDESG